MVWTRPASIFSASSEYSSILTCDTPPHILTIRTEAEMNRNVGESQPPLRF
eukprot:COSAG01_NODE_1821_length_9119_cov_4.375345_13_plen_51_part_00